MKNSLASFEAEFIQFKQETNKTIDNLTELNHYKYQEIKNLNTGILSLTDVNHRDLTLKHIILEVKLVNLQKKPSRIKSARSYNN
jgi:hypothetical protein